MHIISNRNKTVICAIVEAVAIYYGDTVMRARITALLIYIPSTVVRYMVEALAPTEGEIFEIITARLIQFNGYLFRRSRGVQNTSEGAF